MVRARDVLRAADLEDFISWARARRFGIAPPVYEREIYRIRVNPESKFTGIYRRDDPEWVTVSQDIAVFVRIFYRHRAELERFDRNRIIQENLVAKWTRNPDTQTGMGGQAEDRRYLDRPERPDADCQGSEV